MNRVLLILLLLASLSTLAQKQYQPKNLVNNPSFEFCHASRPGKIDGNVSFTNSLVAWKTANKNTPDLKIFNKRKYENCQSRSNYCSKARTGKNMVGIISHMTNNYTDTYREYLVVPLKERLRPNVKTYVEVWVRKGDFGRIVCNNLGFYFSRRAPMENIMTNISCVPQYNHTAVINQDTQKWEKISGSFVPQQVHLFLTIGNFYDNNATITEPSVHHSMPANSSVSYAYYLIDDVRVWQEDDTLELVPPKKVAETAPTTLENTEFETNSAVLMESSKKELQKLVQLLKQQPNLHISIHGHTDNVGDELLNLELSNARAQSVVQFLIEQGIDKERLNSKGFGAEKPIADNQTAAGRARNRRVEFVVLKQ